MTGKTAQNVKMDSRLRGNDGLAGIAAILAKGLKALTDKTAQNVKMDSRLRGNDGLAGIAAMTGSFSAAPGELDIFGRSGSC